MSILRLRSLFFVRHYSKSEHACQKKNESEKTRYYQKIHKNRYFALILHKKVMNGYPYKKISFTNPKSLQVQKKQLNTKNCPKKYKPNQNSTRKNVQMHNSQLNIKKITKKNHVRSLAYEKTKNWYKRGRDTKKNWCTQKGRVAMIILPVSSWKKAFKANTKNKKKNNSSPPLSLLID